MKSTENFRKVIVNYLQKRAETDTLFAASFAKPNKCIDDCITYIINAVHKSGCTAFSDDEVYSMAVHYYDEDNIEIGPKLNCIVVTNHKPELTSEEIAEIKAEAKKKFFEEECNSLKKTKSSAPKAVQKDAEVLELELF